LLVDHDVLYSLFLTDYDFYERLMNFAMNRILDYTLWCWWLKTRRRSI
jgi:hypothetical protein